MTIPILPDAEALLLRLQEGVQALRTPGALLVGIRSGGAWLTERLARALGEGENFGVLTSSLHRDDFAQRGLRGEGLQSQLPGGVQGRDIVLIDDVLHTGRTVRAALNELFDFGRPRQVKLAVLVDRGGRELPLAADFAALTLSLQTRLSLGLQRDEQGRFSFHLQPAP